MKLLLILLCVVAFATSAKISYSRVLNCAQNNTVKCTKWEEATSLTYLSSYTYFCFSEYTHVLTRDGPKSMKELRVHDQIFGYDPETGKQSFSRIMAWMHRDPYAIVDYDLIKTKENLTFEASAYHNIAEVNSQGKIGYKFARDLQRGDELIGFPEANPSALSIKKEKEKRGLYSPFTESGNYYIFSNNFSPSSYSKEDPMILAHSLSQVKDPISEFYNAKLIVEFGQYLGWNAQPSDEQIFIHPLYSNLHYVFGPNWVQAKQQAKYLLSPLLKSPSNHLTHDQRLTSRSSSYTPSYSSSYRPSYSSYSSYSRPYSSYSSYSSPSYSYSSPMPYSYSSYSSPSYSPFYSSYPSYSTSSLMGGGALLGAGAYSTSYQKKKKRGNEITSLGMLISIMQEICLL